MVGLFWQVCLFQHVDWLFIVICVFLQQGNIVCLGIQGAMEIIMKLYEFGRKRFDRLTSFELEVL